MENKRSICYLLGLLFDAGPCLFESGLVPKKMSYQDDAECLNYGIGFTNIVPRTTRGSDDLSR